MSNYSEYQDRLNAFVAQEHAYPASRFSGRGVVICAGGMRYFTNGWVCANILRMHGCQLPIQFWHLGPDEMSEEMRALVRPLGVECVDAREVRKQHPARILNGWELKPYAIIHSPFEEVLFLDSDNVAVKNPEYLFDTKQYADTGALFWPDYDYQRLKPTNPIWDILQIPYRDEWAFESGQIVVDKRRCWKALQVTMHLNEWSDFYYKHIHGDKDTFHLAWHKLRQAYSMPSVGIHSLTGTMCQHDFDGNRLFQHRNLRKWHLNGANSSVPDFYFEKECGLFLQDLRDKWSISPKEKLSPRLQAVEADIIKQRYYMYVRVGYDFRPIEFLPGGKLNAGPAAVESGWSVAGSDNAPKVLIWQGDSVLVDAAVGKQGMLHGNWVQHEKMPCIMLPSSVPVDGKVRPKLWTAQYGEDTWMAAQNDLPDTGVFVEVGAATGVLHSNTYWLEQRGWLGLLIEADERNLASIQRLRLAPVVHCAAAKFDGVTRFVQHRDVTLSGVNRADEDGAVVEIPARRLDTLLRAHKLDTPDLISIDTEGSELDVLDGMGTMRPKYLIVEYVTVAENGAVWQVDCSANKTRLTAKLTEMGYEIVHVTASNLIARYRDIRSAS